MIEALSTSVSRPLEPELLFGPQIIAPAAPSWMPRHALVTVVARR
jgi:hypothetical protein